LISDRAGKTTPHAIENLQERGTIFVQPTMEVYEGQIVGENARNTDLDVNIVREKKLTNMRSSSADDAVRIIPPKVLNLEQAIEFIKDDEFVEVTPTSIRLRKKILKANQR
jgi:GTP-binding protein